MSRPFGAFLAWLTLAAASRGGVISVVSFAARTPCRMT